MRVRTVVEDGIRNKLEGTVVIIEIVVRAHVQADRGPTAECNPVHQRVPTVHLRQARIDWRHDRTRW